MRTSRILPDGPYVKKGPVVGLPDVAEGPGDLEDGPFIGRSATQDREPQPRDVFEHVAA
jgi:hypothetical protein